MHQVSVEPYGQVHALNNRRLWWYYVRPTKGWELVFGSNQRLCLPWIEEPPELNYRSEHRESPPLPRAELADWRLQDQGCEGNWQAVGRNVSDSRSTPVRPEDPAVFGQHHDLYRPRPSWLRPDQSRQVQEEHFDIRHQRVHWISNVHPT